MIHSVIDFCVRQPLITGVLAIAAVVAGWRSLRTTPVDAIPNVGENQVIVFTAWSGRSPKDVEDQVTYPLSVAMLGVSGAESVRGKSLFGYSFVQVTFRDDVDFYWARDRVGEQLAAAAAGLPEGAAPRLGPDATGLGQIFYYVLEPTPGMDLAELRSLQDFVVKYELEATPGVAEVASVGGYVRQYQVDVDPDKLRFHRLTLAQVVQAVRESSVDVGAKTIESGDMEFVVRGRGFVGPAGDETAALVDVEQTVVAANDGAPVRLKDVAAVQFGPDFRRGAIDLNGAEAVGGVVVMRHGENPRQVIDRVKQTIARVEPSLGGVRLRAVYDRTELIDETIGTLTDALGQEMLITAAVIFLFLWHVRASLVVVLTLPLAVLTAFIGMRGLGVDANIMSLAGIAIAIGTMVDMGIVVSESIFDRLAEWEAAGRPGGKAKRLQEIVDAASEVAPAVLTAVATTIISFLPVFMLTGRDYKLFAPLAWTKTFSLASAMVVAVTLSPLLSRFLLRGARGGRGRRLAGAAVGSGAAATACWCIGWEQAATLAGTQAWTAVFVLAALGAVLGWVAAGERMRPAEENRLSRTIHRLYEPTLRHLLAHKLLFFSAPTAIVFLGLSAWFGLSRVAGPAERFAGWFGADLHGLPGYVSAKHLFEGLPSDDWIALDEGSWFYMPTLYPAASLTEAMRVLQTQDVLIKEIPEVRDVLGKIGRVESALDPAPAAMIETYVMLKPREQWRSGSTMQSIWREINAAATLPGVTPASPLQPIEGRVVMLQSGIKASMAIRIYGDDLAALGEAAASVAAQLKQNPFVDAATVNPDIVLGKPYVEFQVDRESAARYGMSVQAVNQVIEAALGGVAAATTVEGRERYAIRVRYQRDARERLDELDQTPVVTPGGQVVPLARLAAMSTTWGPGMISSENARLVAHVAFAPSGAAGDLETVRAVESSLHSARESSELALPPGFSWQAVGSFENQIAANRRLAWVLPLVALTNLFIVYLQFRRLPIALAVFSGIPVAFGGGMITLALVGVELNTAVWVGFIALFGIAVDDGVVIATYLDQVFRKRAISTVQDVRDAAVEAGLRRIRPCLMTTFTTLIALIPVLASQGRGADVARAMAWPVFGGMVVELLTLFVVPVAYSAFKEAKLSLGLDDPDWAAEEDDAV